jgi:chromate transporter
MRQGENNPTFGELLREFAYIGCISFGGPAGQIALMQERVIDAHRWVDQQAFLRALNLCHLLPGPEAQQLATWIGWRLHGWRGGLAAGLLFVIPGAVVMLGLSFLYVQAMGLGWVAAAFLGIKAAVLAVVVQALRRVAGRALGTRFKLAVAVCAFVALAGLQVAYPLVILAAGIAGALAGSVRPQWVGTHAAGTQPPRWTRRRRHLAVQTLLTIALWASIWAAPLVAIALTLGTGHLLWGMGLFFSKLAVVSFGGAYAVLGYMAQAAVGSLGWLSPREMADGLGLAETTPGPLIMVTQFVGFLTGWRHAAPFSPSATGVLAAMLTTWVTFVPCFLWIFAAAPWMERLEHAERLQAALAAITAAVVGVIAQLAFWFALHVLFPARPGAAFGLPDLVGIDWRTALIAGMAALLLFRLRWNAPATLGVCALAGVALSFA